MELDFGLGVVGSVVLFVAILITALLDSLANSLLDMLPLITCFAYLAAIVMICVNVHRYKQNNINLFLAIVCDSISEISSTTLLLLCVYDICMVAATGGLILSILGVMMSLPVAGFTLSITKLPNILATGVAQEPWLIVLDGIGTVLLCFIFYKYFGFSVSSLFLSTR